MKNKILLSLFVLILIGSCSSTIEVKSKRKEKSYKKQTPTLADKVIWTAVSYKGTPYRYGGTTRRGMDCSGLVQKSFAARGVWLPRSSNDMSGKGYEIPLYKTKRGDLLFFRTNPRRPRRITHVGLVTSVKRGVVYFIHASTRRGVIVSNMNENYYRRNFVKAKRIL